ncbi:MAG TPA: hypothetical protein VL053_17460 [Arachidicoccus sp.]|nr:hypothetical protein [Arachidicoccus sp.]
MATKSGQTGFQLGNKVKTAGPVESTEERKAPGNYAGAFLISQLICINNRKVI